MTKLMMGKRRFPDGICTLDYLRDEHCCARKWEVGICPYTDAGSQDPRKG
ncbi:hypothetical protein [Microcoleus sp. FACHB-672]|nr:hypothetical protein [Microcoleus sp. FACHB-672]MBD2044020.1 hypothetical protein [Microcoleus sp. FACHB-672]